MKHFPILPNHTVNILPVLTILNPQQCTLCFLKLFILWLLSKSFT